MRTNACSSSYNRLSIWQCLHKRFSLWTMLDNGIYTHVFILPPIIWTFIISCTIRCITKQVTWCPMSEVVSTRVTVPLNSWNKKSYKDVVCFHLYLPAHFYQLQLEALLITVSLSCLLISFWWQNNLTSQLSTCYFRKEFPRKSKNILKRSS